MKPLTDEPAHQFRARMLEPLDTIDGGLMYMPECSCGWQERRWVTSLEEARLVWEEHFRRTQ